MTANDAHVLLCAFCDELARCGMTDACTSPGSRCAPLVLSLAREPGLRCWSHLDERCAGFFALGAAKASGRPCAVACTSGTAAANLTPAVHEAREARVPMVVLTADRPPELREVGAGQVIDQVKLFGSAAKWFFEVGTHEATPERVRWMRALACRAYWRSLEGRPGVVHLNFPLREPLVVEGDLPLAGRDPKGAPVLELASPSIGTVLPEPEAAHASYLQGLVEGHPRGVVVCGRLERDEDLGAIAVGFAEAAGYPLLADPLSGARRATEGTAYARRSTVVAHYDALLRSEPFAEAQQPDLVIRVGDLPTSKPLRAWLASASEALQVILDPEAAWQDPDAAAGIILPVDPRSSLSDAASLLRHRGSDRDREAWVTRWRQADDRAARAIEQTLGTELSEPAVASTLGARLSAQTTLVVASSMPVRDVETFFPARDEPARVLSNRGANGIDGTVSTAFGVAAATGGEVVVLIGDVALAHDLGGLLAASRLGLKLTIILLNNDGGGIFHFLPLAGEADVFEDHVATPHGLEFAHAAALYGCDHALIEDLPGLSTGLERALKGDRTTILEVRTERQANLALHRRVWDAVAVSVSER